MFVFRVNKLLRLAVTVTGLFFLPLGLQSQNSPNEVSSPCLEQGTMPWTSKVAPAGNQEQLRPDLIVFRVIQPGDAQELFYKLGAEYFCAQRHPDGSWNIKKQPQAELGDFMITHWSALRDDLVKPFRLKQNSNTSSEKPEDYRYSYVIFYRNICVERQFNRKDLDSNWAEDNATYIFNQTLKLTEMHRLMDNVFLSK